MKITIVNIQREIWEQSLNLAKINETLKVIQNSNKSWDVFHYKPELN